MTDWGSDDYDDVETDHQGQTAPALYYGSVDEFVREYLRHVYKRRVDGRCRASDFVAGQLSQS